MTRIRITGSAVGIKICAITARIKKYNSIIKKKKKKHDKIVLLGRDKLSTKEVLIYKALIDSYISHEELVSVSNVSEYNEMKKKWKILQLQWNIPYRKAVETYWVSCKKYTASKASNARKTKQNRLMLLLNYAACGKKKSTFIKKMNSANLIMFQMISLKWTKPLTNFYWLETKLCQNRI